METIDDLWNSYETVEPESILLSEKIAILDKLISEYDKQDKERAQQLSWERSAIGFMVSVNMNLRSLDGENRDFTNTCVDSFMKSIDVNKAVDYFNKRIEITANPFHKARLSYCAWILKKEVVFLQIGVRSFLEVAKVCFDAGKWMDCIHNLETAYAMSVKNNVHTLAEEVVKETLELIPRLEHKKEYRWIIEPLEIIARHGKRKNLDSIIVEDLISKADKCASYYADEKNYHLQRSFLEQILRLTDRLSLQPSEMEQLKKNMRTKIAESYETEGERKLAENNALAAIFFFKHAITQYHAAGNPDKEKGLMQKIGDSTKGIKWKEMKAEVNLPELKFEGTAPTEIYNEICNYSEPVPPLDSSNGDSELDLSDIIPTMTFNERYPIADSEEKDPHETKKKRKKVWYIQLAEARFASAFKVLEEQRKASADSLIDFLSDSGFFGDNLNIIAIGIRRHFDGDYISSIHILVPQMEDALRSLLKLKGIPIEKTDAGAISVKDMGGILAEDDTKKILGEEFVTYLKLKFTEKEGMNVRNEVAHGLLRAEKFNHTLSSSLLYVLLKLSKLALK